MHSESGKIVLGFEKIMDALKTGALGEIVVHEHNKSQKFLLKNISTGGKLKTDLLQKVRHQY